MAESMVFYRSFYEALKLLPTDEDKFKALTSMIELGLDGIDNMPNSPASAVVYVMAKPQILANVERREVAKRGGAPKGNQNARKKQPKTTETTDGCFENNKKQPNVNDNANDNDNVNDNDNANDYYYKGTDVVVDDFTLIKMFVDNFGRQPSKFEIDRTMWMFTAYDRELVEDAFEVAAQQDKKNIAYVMGILNKQKEAGISNMEDLAQYNMEKGRV